MHSSFIHPFSRILITCHYIKGN